MNCPDHQTISAFVDGELEALEAARVQDHVAGCPGCRSFVEEMQWIDSRGRAALQALPEKEVWFGVTGRKRARPALLAAAAMVVAALTIWIWFTGRNQTRQQQTVTGSVSSASGNGQFHGTDELGFERWAAKYRELRIPRVPLEVAARYDPAPISPVQPNEMERNH